MILRLKKAENHELSLFFRFLIPYLIILLIPVLVGVLSYIFSLRTVENEVIEKNTALLELSRDILEQRITEINTMVDQLDLNPLVRRFQSVRSPFEGANTYQVRYTIQNLDNYALSNNFLLAYYILFPNSRLILAPDYACSFDTFDDYGLQYGDVQTNELIHTILGSHHYGTFLKARDSLHIEKPIKVMPFIRSLGYPGYSQASALVLIDDAKFQELFEGLDLGETGWAYILDGAGNVLTRTAQADVAPEDIAFGKLTGTTYIQIEDQRFLLNYAHSEITGWQYVAAQPYRRVMKKVAQIKNIAIYIVCVSVLVGIGVSFLLAYWNTTPLHRIFALFPDSVVKGTEQSGETYGYLQEKIVDLLEDRKALKRAVEEQQPFLKTSYVGQLLYGRFHDNRELATVARHIGIPVTGVKYVVGVFSSRHGDIHLTEQIARENDEIKTIVRNSLSRYFAYDVLCYDINENTLGVLLTLEDSPDDECRSMIDHVLNRMIRLVPQNYDLQIRFCLGTICSNPMNVATAFEEAKDLCMSSSYSEDRIMWYADHSVHSRNYYYPDRLEFRLMNAVKIGDADLVRSTLDELFVENFELRDLSGYLLRIFRYELVGTFGKLLDELERDDETMFSEYGRISEGIADGNIHESDIQGLFNRLCESVNRRKESHNHELIDRIKRFVEANYSDPGICLDMLADRFGLSIAYLSKFFREQSGENFSGFLERLRIERAMRLLCDTRLSIKEIANDVGYTSANTFCRAFKRFANVNATDYRSANTISTVET